MSSLIHYKVTEILRIWSKFFVNFDQGFIFLLLIGRDQLPTADSRAGRRSGQSESRRLLPLQHDGHHGGVGQARPQIWPYVC